MEATILGYIGIKGICWGYIGIMEKRMETTIIHWGYIRVRIIGSLGFLGFGV